MEHRVIIGRVRTQHTLIASREAAGLFLCALGTGVGKGRQSGPRPRRQGVMREMAGDDPWRNVDLRIGPA